MFLDDAVHSTRVMQQSRRRRAGGGGVGGGRCRFCRRSGGGRTAAGGTCAQEKKTVSSQAPGLPVNRRCGTVSFFHRSWKAPGAGARGSHALKTSVSGVASHFLPGVRSSARVCSSDVWAKLRRWRMRSLADVQPLSSFDG